MKPIDRILLLTLTLGIWALVALQFKDRPAQAALQDLTRYDVSTAIRSVMREFQPANANDVRQAVVETLRRCTITGRLTEGEVNNEDATDFTARIHC